MSEEAGAAGGFEPEGRAAQGTDATGTGDAIDRVWGSTSPTGLLFAAFFAAAVLFGGILFTATAYGPTEAEPATVLRQYNSSTGSGRSICGIEVQVASGETTKAAGGNVCSVYEEGDQAVALVSTLTGDVVGVRHAGRDLGRSGNPLVGLLPVFALVSLVSVFRAAGRRAGQALPKTAGAAAAGALTGLVLYWLLF
jgi:hypothetical protein